MPFFSNIIKVAKAELIGRRDAAKDIGDMEEFEYRNSLFELMKLESLKLK